MKVFLIIMMFLSTSYGISTVADNYKEVSVGIVTTKKILSPLPCVAITVIDLAFIVMCAYLLVKVV